MGENDAMTGGQWFQLWIALAQVGVAAAVVAVALFAGARRVKGQRQR